MKRKALFDVAARQHSVFTMAQALEFGASRSSMHRWVAEGSIAKKGCGVYMVAGVSPTWKSRLMALTLQTGGCASHRSAARLHGLDTYQQVTDVEVTVAHSRRFAGSLGFVHQTRAPDLMRPEIVDGIPVVGLARVPIDLTAVVTMRRVAKGVDDIRRLRGVEDSEIWESYLLHRRRGRPGMKKLGVVLSEQLGTEVNDSTFEFLALRVFEDAGLPPPNVHFVATTEGGEFIAEVDFAYPRHKIAIELDSKKYHLNIDSFERDPRKRLRLQREHWHFVKITWSMLRDDPAEVVAAIIEAMAYQEKVLRALGEWT